MASNEGGELPELGSIEGGERSREAFGSRSGLLPPDGVAWPPEPAPTSPPPRAPDSLATTARRPDDAQFGDWRTMPIDAPVGYRGSTTAPAGPRPRVDGWSVASAVLALVGVVPVLWGVPLAPVLAIGFGLAGRRVCSLDTTRRGAIFATLGVLIGGATLLAVAAGAAAGKLTLFR